MAEKQSNKERIKEITAGIEQGIKDLFESGKYQQYLTTMSRFHRYSLNNVMLIHSQMPDATLVAGFNKWKNQFGRHVKKGEKGISILAPTPYKIKVEKEKLDPDTQLPVLDADGNTVTEEKEVSIPMFKVVKVFDVSQTDGKPLPQLAMSLSGDVQQYEMFIEALRRTSPVPIDIKPIQDDTDGFLNLETQRITLREGMSQVQTICACVHEIAHSKLHNYQHMTIMADDGETALAPEEKDRHTEEVEAESISYAVCKYFGIETAENSFGYIASWSEGKELKELRNSLETINKTSSELITLIEHHFTEITKEREAEIEPEKPLSEMNILEMVEHFMDQGMTEEQANELANSEWQARKINTPPPDIEEAIYLLENQQYLHMQLNEGGYWDFSLYNANTLKLIDGGLLDDTDMSIVDARNRILESMDQEPKSIDTIPDDEIQELLDKIHDVAIESVNSVQPLEEIAPPVQENIDPYMSVEDMNAFGYTSPDMYPVCTDFALELMERDITVYMLYNNNTEAMAFDSEDLAMHTGLFGITHEDWDAVKEQPDILAMQERFRVSYQHDHPTIQQREQDFLGNSGDAFAIYQLKREDSTTDLRFMNTDWLKKKGLEPDRQNYDLVYTDTLYPSRRQTDTLNQLYQTFNINHPHDFTGHSLSVSDVVVLKQNGVLSAHYVDSVGFKEIHGFLKPENYLKTAEMQMEDDFGMIDGIINNGKAPAKTEEVASKKPSVMEKLKKQTNTPHRKKSHKKSKEDISL